MRDKTANLSDALLTLDQPEQEYTRSMPPEHIRRYSQFFTPLAAAQFMADWVMGAPACQTVLDPAAGMGIFLDRVLRSERAQPALVGMDLDPLILAECRKRLQSAGEARLDLREGDYLRMGWEERFDGILCNPPYHRFQHYSRRKEILAEFETRLGVSFSGLTNLHSLFLLKSVYQLNPHGRAAYIVPSEFLNADYGVPVKKYLIQSGCLKYVLIFDYGSSIFGNVITTACILLMAKDEPKDSLDFIPLRDPSELGQVGEQIRAYPALKAGTRRVNYSALRPARKWHAYYQETNGANYTHLVPLATYGNVMRGIATGHNDFFCFNRSKARDEQIASEYLLPCLSKAAQVRTPFFTQAHFDDLMQKDKQVYLLKAENAPDEAVKRYLNKGEQKGVQHRFLTSHRRPWYAIENRPPAPILVTVFNRAGLRFIRNETQARSLTCFHSLYLNDSAAEKIDLLMAYLLTDVARTLFTHNRREYGDGLVKFEPNDLSSAQVIDLSAVPASLEGEILALYHSYRRSVLNEQPNEALVDQINQSFLQIL